MTRKLKRVLKDVTHEIEMLKKYATDEEKSFLEFGSFDPNNPNNCIYGQMTGDCESARAKELMDKACTTVMDLGTEGVGQVVGVDIDSEEFSVNGKYTGQTWLREQAGYRDYRYVSVLEAYIATDGARVNHIMEYIRGEVNKLEL